MAYKGVDYMDLDSELSSEERMARDTVRRFVDVEVLPVIEEAYSRAASRRRSSPVWRSSASSAPTSWRSTAARA